MSKREPRGTPLGRSRRLYFLLMFAALASASCEDDPMGVTPEGLQPSRLEYFGGPARIEVPEQATVGSEVVIGIKSYGGGCIEPGPTIFDNTGARVVIRPEDVFPDPNRVCFDILVMIDHSVGLTFDEPGEVRLVVHGARIRSDADGSIHRDLITITRTITVLETGS